MPVAILACAATDATLRLLPFEIAAPSAFLAASRWLRPDQTLTPNRSFQVEEYGELARLGNLRQFVHYRRTSFTTDSLGYRNPPGLAGQELHLLVAGDSFALGMSVSDNETLSSRLWARLGQPVYNGALVQGTASASRIHSISRRIGLHQGTVIYEYLNRMPVTRHDLQRPERPTSAPSWLPDALWTLHFGFQHPAFERGFACTINSRLEDGVLLPNPAAKRVFQERLKNGDTMLVYWQDKQFYQQPAPASQTVDGFRWLAQEVKKDNLQLLVVLTPTGYTAYQQLLDKPFVRDTGGAYLQELESELRKASIPVVNLLPGMRAEAAKGFDRHEYLYWMDDAHWNPRGIDVAARLIAEGIHALQ